MYLCKLEFFQCSLQKYPWQATKSVGICLVDSMAVYFKEDSKSDKMMDIAIKNLPFFASDFDAISRGGAAESCLFSLSLVKYNEMSH